MKKLFAGMSAVAITVTQMGTAMAAYSDVAAGVWYEDAVEAFTDAGYLDGSQTRFRGGDNANRAEFIKLVVELNGGILSTAPAVPSFDDVRPGAWYYGYMEEAAKEGWVKGDANCYGSKPCNARPGANINRAEAAALIVRAFGLESTGDAPSFVDVPSGQWYTDSVQTAADYCVLQGDDSTGRARPADFMNRAEMVVMLHRVDMGLTYGVDCESGNTVDPMITDVTPTSASTVEVEFSVDLDEDAATDASKYMVSGDDEIEVTSVDMVDDSTVELTLQDSTNAGDDYTLSVEDMETADGETFSDSMDFSGYTMIEQGDGTLEVSLASTNPSADTVPKGAVGVVMTSVDLTASCDDDVIISEITVLHEGFGESTEVVGVYAAVDGSRLTRKRSINSQDQTAILRFQEPLVIEACDSVTVDVVADFETGSAIETGAEHNFAIELPSDFQSNARDVEGNFPVRGNTFKIAAVTSGTISVDYRNINPSETDVGRSAVVVGKYEIEAGNEEDQTLYSITLEQNGGVSDGDVTNIKLRRTDGTVLTNTVATTTGDYVTLVFDPPFTILEGDTITLELVADIEGGAGEDVSFQLEEESDLFAVGSLYGYGVNGQLYGSPVTIGGTLSAVDIDAGQLTIELDGPTSQSYTPDDDDAVLAKVNISSGQEPVDIQNLYIAIRAATSTGAVVVPGVNVGDLVSNVELRNTQTGRSVSATEITATDSTTVVVFRLDDFLVDGNETWEIRTDFVETTNLGSGDRFRVEVCASTTTCAAPFGTTYVLEAEGQSTGDEIDDVRPNTVVAGNYHDIASPEVVIAVESIGSTETAVRNSKNVTLLRFSARSGEGEDVLFTGADFEAEDGTMLNAQNYTLWVDSDGDSVVDTILEKGVAAEGSAGNEAASFSDLAGGGYVIPAEETVIFEVHADVSSAIQGDNQLELAFTSVNDIEVEEVDNGSAIDEVTLTEVNSKLYTFVSAGDLFVTKDSESVRSRQLLGGTLADSVLRLNFRAQNEDIEVTQIQIASTGSFVGANSVDRLELYKSGETTAFATATANGCGSDAKIATSPGEMTFCANIQNTGLSIQRGKDVDVIVRPRLKTDENGARSSSGVTFWTGSGTALAFGVEARGLNSSSDLTISDGDGTAEGEIVIGNNSLTGANAAITGNANMVVLSKITSIANANPDANNTNVPTGVRPIGQFRFTAASNNNTRNGTNRATLSGVIFTVSATNVNLDSADFKFYNNADSSTKANCVALNAASGSLLVSCANVNDTAVDTEIDSGESVTFVLEADIENPQVSASANSTLQVSIQDFTDASETTYGAAASHLEWVDQDTASYSFFWIEYTDTVVNSTSYRS